MKKPLIIFLALAMAAERAEELGQAFQCAVNALLANLAEAALYSAAVGYAIDAGEAARAQEYLNEGLWVFPEDGALNYLAAYSLAAGDTGSARAFQAARANAGGELLVRINALDGQIGG